MNAIEFSRKLISLLHHNYYIITIINILLFIEFLNLFFSGTKKERGLSAWQIAKSLEEAEGVDSDFKTRVMEIYTPLIPRKCLQFKFIKYIPFLPFLEKSE